MGMKNIVKIFVGVAFAALVTIFAVAYGWYFDNRKPNFVFPAEIYVCPGLDAEEILSQIPDSCIVSRKSLVRVMKGLEKEQIKSGHYLLEKGKPSVYLPRMLRGGWQTPVRLVLSGTMRTKGSIARKISNQMLLDSVVIAGALSDDELLSRYGFSSVDAFSLIVPDTYEIYWTASAEEILDVQKKAWDSFWTEENLSKAASVGLTPREVSILASIVKAESNYEKDYPSIAGVYLNRLRLGMRLQADPTVAFCYDYSLKRILLKHLEVDSPYNTYLHEGLPPGPICVPDKACLKAVLNPDRRDFLYFCASPAMDGTHRFASTLSEHNRNAAEFQRELNKRSK